MAQGASLESWKEAGEARVVDRLPRHSIHSYFNASPESPDGKWVLVFTSVDPEGHLGDITILHRETGEARVLARDVIVEDAHRQAYQQWTDGGRAVIYQRFDGERWTVHRVTLADGEDVVLAADRQVAWGQPLSHVVPLHGMHWQPGAHRNLELLDVRTGAVRSVLTPETVAEAYPAWVGEHFQPESPLSIFFPVLSPDGNRAMFKLSQPASGIHRDRKASRRHGLIVYDIAQQKLLMQRHLWGHPAWHPDSRTIITPQNIIIDSDTGAERQNKALPEFPGSHPTFHPGGHLIASDFYQRGQDIPPGWWAVGVGDPDTGEVARVHALRELPGGAKSWRPPHPHPAFTADGRRLYFNVSAGEWTRLHVVEV